MGVWGDYDSVVALRRLTFGVPGSWTLPGTPVFVTSLGQSRLHVIERSFDPGRVVPRPRAQ